MSKFTGPDDGNYHAVRNEILRMIGMLNGKLEYINYGPIKSLICFQILKFRGHLLSGQDLQKDTHQRADHIMGVPPSQGIIAGQGSTRSEI